MYKIYDMHINVFTRKNYKFFFKVLRSISLTILHSCKLITIFKKKLYYYLLLKNIFILLNFLKIYI